ncbi:alpha/beta fold hydrolase [Metapseudomonas resinovorans]|uniref:alpha/beta fold hydrolase n=1 Tax=Metapseudomonas resinovorans TaxID=53412 RepID=UPI00040F6C2E|nr:alpha/beta hydrolase [Pseudomonas resinovorans]
MSNNSFGDSRVDHSGFERHVYLIDGCETVVYTAGQGEPLVFLHGGGTWHGIDFAHAWTDRFRVILPYHPGFGQSGDNPSFDSLQDYLQHYQELFDVMGLERFHLVGFSLGGRMAAEYAIQHGHQIEKLVLIAPAGLDVKEYPQPDFMVIPPEEIPSYLVNDLATLAAFLPMAPDNEFGTMRMREGGSVARISRNGVMTNPKLPNWLHRIRMPTLLIWGENDRIVPPGQAEHWHRLLPHADVKLFPNAGHLVLDESGEARSAVSDFLA